MEEEFGKHFVEHIHLFLNADKDKQEHYCGRTIESFQ